MSKTVILTGLRANNDLHLGNYLGALQPIIALQEQFNHDDAQINLFVPDLHSFTTPIDHSQLYAQTLQNLKLFVAAGLKLDQDNTFIYRQSRIPAHSELTVILNCFSFMGELSRMTQFKEKSDKQDNVSVGLFDYPVLMAADILLYHANLVPVGEDQSQHVELARDIATRMNNKFGEQEPLFTLPEVYGTQSKGDPKDKTARLRIRDLVEPTKKMSKSDESGKGVIFLSDSPDVAAKKVMGATTDSIGLIQYDMENQPGISNLLQLLATLKHASVSEIEAQYKGQTQYGELKKDVAEAVKAFLEAFQAKLSAVDEQMLLDKLAAGEAAMQQTATQTLTRVQEAVGLRSRT